MNRIICVILAAALGIVGCQERKKPEEKSETPQKEEKVMAFVITSTAFEEGGMIPSKYTCDGIDVSPPLSWNGIPEGAKSLALISDDPDAPMGTWVHWVLFDLPPDKRELAENAGSSDSAAGGRHGYTDFGKPEYGGPCPPSGVHRYYFKLYALDIMPDLSGRVTKDTLLAAMEGHVLAEGQLMGKYKRQ